MKKKRLKLSQLLKKADQAIREAVRETLLDHKRKGLPIYVLQNNKVVRIPAHRIHPR